MKAKDVHKGLLNEQVRDFLGRIYQDTFMASSPKYIEERIKKLSEELKEAKKGEAVSFLLDSLGYTVFDVSDEIEDYSSTTYIPFVGTEEEYKCFLIKAMEAKK